MINKNDILISLLREINKLVDELHGSTETINKLKSLISRIIYQLYT